jgi:hypothetical protein
METLKFKSMLLLISGLCAGCGGSLDSASLNNIGPGTPANTFSGPVLGIYYGQFTPPGNGAVQVYGAIIPQGPGYFATTQGAVYVLPALPDPAHIAGTVTGYAGPGQTFPSGQTQVAYNITASASVTGSNTFYSSIAGGVFQGSVAGSLNLGYKSISQATFPVSQFVGTYQGFYWGINTSITLTVNADGTFTGADGVGCSLSGRLSNASGNTNTFQVSLQRTGPSACPATLNGAAYMDVNDVTGLVPAPADHLLYMGVWDGTTASVAEFNFLHP